MIVTNFTKVIYNDIFRCNYTQYHRTKGYNFGMDDPLYWDSTFEIVQQLKTHQPRIVFEEISLNNIFELVTNLPNFADDPSMCNETILREILTVWIEETL